MVPVVPSFSTQHEKGKSNDYEIGPWTEQCKILWFNEKIFLTILLLQNSIKVLYICCWQEDAYTTPMWQVCN